MLFWPSKKWFQVIWYEWEGKNREIIFEKIDDNTVIIRENYDKHMKKRYEETAEWRKKIMSFDNL